MPDTEVPIAPVGRDHVGENRKNAHRTESDTHDRLLEPFLHRADNEKDKAQQQGDKKAGSYATSYANRPDRADFVNPFERIAQANAEFSKTGTLTAEIKKEYESAIFAADRLDQQHLAALAKKGQEELAKAFPKERQEKVVKLEREKEELLIKLPEETKKRLEELGKKLSGAREAEEQETIKKEMRDLVPDIARKQDEIDELTAKPRAIMEQLALIEHLVKAPALTRFAYAEALRQSGDKARARAMLEEVIKLDPSSANDHKVREAAAAVGLKLEQKEPQRPLSGPPRRIESGMEPPYDEKVPRDPGDNGIILPPSEKERQPEDPGMIPSDSGKRGQLEPAEKPDALRNGAKQEEERDPLRTLQQAHAVNEKQGFAAAKPLFEKAIGEADQLDMKSIGEQIEKIRQRLADPALDARTRQDLEQLGSMFLTYRQAPVVTRFQFAIAQNNSGDHDGALATLAKIGQISAETAKDPVFKAVLDLVSKKERITEDTLRRAMPQEQERDGAVAPADNPFMHAQTALEQDRAGNAKSAVEAWQKAIETADKLPIEQYKQNVAQVDAALKVEADPIKSLELVKLKEAFQELIALPVMVRLEAARFYLQHAKGDEAKALLQQAVQKDASISNNPGFKQLKEASDHLSKGAVEKALAYLKSTGQELGSDVLSGGGAMAIASITPGGRLLRFGVGLVAGGSIKHTLSLAGLGGDPNSVGKNFVHGMVDFAAVAAGMGLRNKAMASFENRLTSKTLQESLMKIGYGEAEALAALEGKTGLAGLKRVTQLVTDNVAFRKDIAKAELQVALREAPLLQKPLIWMQAHSPFLWRLPTKSLAGYRAAWSDYMAARGSGLSYLNPMRMLSSVEGAGSLKGLEATTFWNRYRIDALGAGGASLVYRGFHESQKAGQINPDTGQLYSDYEIIANIATGTLTDAITGGFLVGAGRSVGGFVSRGPLGRLIGTGGGEAGALSRAITGSAAVLSPRLYEVYGSWEKQQQYEQLLSDIQKPLTDANPKGKPEPPVEKPGQPAKEDAEKKRKEGLPE